MSTKDHTPYRDALDTAITAANLIAPLVDHRDGRAHLMIPDGYRIEDVSDPDRLRGHIGQRITVDDRASLTAYANRFSDHRSIVMADYDTGSIRVYMDWHHDNAHDLTPQHAAHNATLKLRDSEEYKRWNKMEGDMHSQAEFAIFVEENVADVIDPEQGVLLEICRDLEASQGVAFKSGTRLDNGDRSFTYETETRVKSEIAVPTEIILSIPLYQGEPEIDIRAKFRFRPTPGGLMLGFRWHRVEYQRQALFSEMAFKTADETGLPVYFGRVTP